jgi:Uma2 family endonuclease
MSVATMYPGIQTVLTPEQLEPPFEMIDGVPKEKPRMGLFANILASYLSTAINNFSIPRRLGMAINETTHKVDDQNSRRPDVSYVEYAKMPAWEILLDDPPLLEAAPNVAIEIVSPSNTIAEMDTRIEEFFTSGVQLVWVVHPQSKQIYVYESTKDCKILEIGDMLDGGNVLPGFTLALAEMFDVARIFPR